MAKVDAQVDDGLSDDELPVDARGTPREDKLVIYDGATIAQLSEMFHMDNAKVRKLLRHISPCGKRRGADIYAVKEAAAYLVEPVMDEEKFIRSLTRTQDLPGYLQKEIWQARLNRQKYETQAGDLWPTEDVLSVFGEVFKKLKTGISLFADTIEARTELSAKQRQLIVELSDGLCTELHRVLIDGDYEREHKSEREKVISDAD